MQAIETRVIPATTHKPTRIKATCWAGSVTISYQCEGMDKAHKEACLALLTKLEWLEYGKWTGGTIKNGNMVWVCSYATNEFLMIEA